MKDFIEMAFLLASHFIGVFQKCKEGDITEDGGVNDIYNKSNTNG